MNKDGITIVDKKQNTILLNDNGVKITDATGNAIKMTGSALTLTAKVPFNDRCVRAGRDDRRQQHRPAERLNPMGELVVVKGDPVSGTDKHHVSGQATNPSPPPPTVPYTGVADFDVQRRDDRAAQRLRPHRRRSRWRWSPATVRSTPVRTPHRPASTAGPQGTNFVPPTPVPVASYAVHHRYTDWARAYRTRVPAARC